eukprot:TRINITY_DN1499_c0_g1_i1.p1 TRINITY_DN1499_c0_g1~~TRINITY_DN1499_c0_g1_i1.p1  ORF type:complete len:430 (-),score=27.17 TRINITY_DN1499_c0_g1_i1:79-1368(-)
MCIRDRSTGDSHTAHMAITRRPRQVHTRTLSQVFKLMDQCSAKTQPEHMASVRPPTQESRESSDNDEPGETANDDSERTKSRTPPTGFQLYSFPARVSLPAVLRSLDLKDSRSDDDQSPPSRGLSKRTRRSRSLPNAPVHAPAPWSVPARHRPMAQRPRRSSEGENAPKPKTAVGERPRRRSEEDKGHRRQGSEDMSPNRSHWALCVEAWHRKQSLGKKSLAPLFSPEELASQHEQMGKALKHMSKRTLSFAWRGWREKAAELVGQERAASRAIRKMLNLKLAVAWDSWRVSTALHKAALALAAKVVGRLQYQLMSRGFDCLWEHAQAQRVHKSPSRRPLASMATCVGMFVREASQIEKPQPVTPKCRPSAGTALHAVRAIQLMGLKMHILKRGVAPGLVEEHCADIGSLTKLASRCKVRIPGVLLDKQ